MVHDKKIPHIALVGAGQIGGTLAHLIVQRKIGRVTLFDVNGSMARGKALDLAQSGVTDDLDIDIKGTDQPEDLKNADVVIITAGLARKPGMSRDDLLKINSGILKEVALNIKQYCSDAFVIVITNPLDAMVSVFQKKSGLPTHKVVGMAGVLDASRYRHFLAKALGVSAADICAFVLGGHGDSMVPLSRFTTISGIPLFEFMHNKPSITMSDIKDIEDRTRQGGAEIVNLLQTGSAFYAPAASALQMAESYLRNLKRVVPCASYLNGEYGVYGLYVGVPVIIGAQGVEKVIELDLLDDEKKAFDVSVQAVKDLTARL